MKSVSIVRGAWRIALLCVLVAGCGKYGPPQRIRDDPREIEVEATESVPGGTASQPDDEEESP